MKTLNIHFTEKEYRILKKAKVELGEPNWRQFLLQNARAYLKLKDLKLK